MNVNVTPHELLEHPEPENASSLFTVHDKHQPRSWLKASAL